MRKLQECTVDEQLRAALIRDCKLTLEGEIDAKTGMIAYAVRKAYQLVGKLEHGNLITNVFDKLLNEFVEAAEPFEDAYAAQSGSGSFAEYLCDRDAEFAEALLLVTDRERDRVGNPVLVTAYQSLRNPAHKLLVGSIPAVAGLLNRYKITPREELTAAG